MLTDADNDATPIEADYDKGVLHGLMFAQDHVAHHLHDAREGYASARADSTRMVLGAVVEALEGALNCLQGMVDDAAEQAGVTVWRADEDDDLDEGDEEDGVDIVDALASLERPKLLH